MIADLNGAAEVGSTVISCPVGFGGTILLIFGYADGSRLVVDVDTSGCQFATNGDRTIRTPIIGLLGDLLGDEGS